MLTLICVLEILALLNCERYIFRTFVIFSIFTPLRSVHVQKIFIQKSKTIDCPKCKIGDYVRDGKLRELQCYTCTLLALCAAHVYEVRVSVKDVFIDTLSNESQM